MARGLPKGMNGMFKDVGKMLDQTGVSLNKEFTAKVTENQVMMQENQVVFGKYLKIIRDNQTKIIKKLEAIEKKLK